MIYTPEPTSAPTPAPTSAPTPEPTPEPTFAPTPEPTPMPTIPLAQAAQYLTSARNQMATITEQPGVILGRAKNTVVNATDGMAGIMEHANHTWHAAEAAAAAQA